MTALAAAHGSRSLGDAGALTGGYSAAFTGAAAVAAAGALVAAAGVRRTAKSAAA